MANPRFFYAFPTPYTKRSPIADLDLSNLSTVTPRVAGEAFMAGSIPLHVYVDYLLNKLYQDFHDESYVRENFPPDPDRGLQVGLYFMLGLAVRYCALGTLTGLKLPDRSELRRCLISIQDDASIGEAKAVASDSRKELKGKGGDGKEEPAKEAGSKYGEIPAEMLEEPLLRELIVALALTVWNKDLAKAIVADFPPTPHADVLFGLSDSGPGTDGGGGGGGGDAPGPAFFLANLAFGPPGPTPVLAKDNGSDLVATFVAAGWTSPFPCFFIHACASPDAQAGVDLVKVLADPALRQWVASCGDEDDGGGGDPEIVGHFLYQSVYCAAQPSVVSALLGVAMPLIRASPTLGRHPFLTGLKRRLSHAAAVNGPDFIQAVIDHGADDLYGIDRGAEKRRVRREGPGIMFERGPDTPPAETTALHYAACHGNPASVKFLLGRDDVKKLLDGEGRNAYHAALIVRNNTRDFEPDKVELIQKLEEVVALFEKNGWTVKQREPSRWGRFCSWL